MEFISKFYNHLISSSLYKNSIYLMLSTGVMAFLGFFFWIINARLFTTTQVGIATTLISTMTLISSLSILGLGNSLIKYLPTSDNKGDKINTSLTLVGLTSILISIIFLIFLRTFSIELLFIKENIFLAVLFILSVLFSSLNMIAESIFIAYRSAKYVLVKNTIASLTKLVMPIFLISFGAYGIFMSVGISSAIAFSLGLFILLTNFNILLIPTIKRGIVKRMLKFSLGNYLAGFIGGFPVMILPLVITNSVGASFSAYFYMDMMIANLLYIIPLATSQSLLAEGSYSEVKIKEHLKKSVKIILILLFPAILITLMLGKYILLAFGNEYSNEGVIFLQILTVSSIFFSINCLGNAIFYIKHKIKLIIIMNTLGACLILFLSALLIRYNLLGIGIAWIVGQGAISAVYLFYVRRFIKF